MIALLAGASEIRWDRRKFAWRAFWAAALLLHAPITFNVFFAAFRADSVSWPSLLLLAASNLYFVFEVVFAGTLRLLSNRRALVAFLLVLVLVHAGVIERSLPDLSKDWNLQAGLIVTALATVTLACLLLAIYRALIVLADSSFEFHRQWARWRYGRAPQLARVLHPQSRKCRYAVRRGPPR